MRSIRTILALAAICGFAAGSTSAQEDTFYFDVPEGDWDTATNWDPTNGPPDYGDTAIIQDGQHCHVQTAGQDCKIFKVLDGGTLTIEAPYWLRVGSYAEHSTCVIGGDVRFLKQTDGFPMLVIRQGGVTLSGANGGGTLNASKADGLGKGYIGAIDASTQVLEVGSDITVKGSYLLYAHIENNGTFIVDDPNDTMTFSKVVDRPRPKVGGTGTFDVSAGTLTFHDCILKTDNSTIWDLSGTGTIHVTSQCRCGDTSPPACAIDIRGGERLWVERAAGPSVPPQLGVFRTYGEFNMSDGTLDLDGKFRVRARAVLSGGTIKVAPGKAAVFVFPQ